MEALNIGYNNVVLKDKVVAIVNTDSKPARRLKERAEQEGRLVDATSGRKARALILTSSNHVIISSINIRTLSQRISEEKR